MAKHKRTSKYAVNAGKQEMPKMPTSPLKSDQAKQLARESGNQSSEFWLDSRVLKRSKGVNVMRLILVELHVLISEPTAIHCSMQWTLTVRRLYCLSK